MFLARDIVVSLAFFIVMHSTLSALIGLAWRLRQQLPFSKGTGSPRFLFGLRIFPFAFSTLVAVFFTFPSFWLMERRSLDEEAPTFVLAACALVLLSVGMVRAFKAGTLTGRAVRHWRMKPSAEQTDSYTLSAAKGAPALILVGICQARVMVSDMATAVLTESELRVAMRHELGHRSSWDNLKKLLINATPFPGMRGIEKAWREAAELAADNSAVKNRQDALDLASALIKLSRSTKEWVEPELAIGLVCGSSRIDVRVHHLLKWRKSASPFESRLPWALLSLLLITFLASNYGSALVLTHRLTELLVP